MRNNAWVALAIVGIIMAFALTSSNGGSGGPIDVQEDGSPVVNNTFVLDFQTPLTATDDGGDADIGLAVNDCDAADNALTFSVGPNTFGCNTITSAAALNVELNGTITVTGADVIDFLSPFNVTDVAGDAQIDLPLADDSVFVGSSSGVPTETAWPDCNLDFQATTYSTGSNAIGCQFIPTSYIAQNYSAVQPASLPGIACTQQNTVLTSRQNQGIFGLIVPPQTTTYTAIGINVTTAGAGGSLARLGIYEGSESGTGVIPGALVLDAGTVSIASTGIKSIAISTTLTRGQPYFTVFVHDSASDPAFSICNPANVLISTMTGRASGFSSSAFNLSAPIAFGVGTGGLSDPAATPLVLSSFHEGTIIKLSE